MRQTPLEGELERSHGALVRHPEVREIDLDPVIASPAGAMAVDALVVLEDGAA